MLWSRFPRGIPLLLHSRLLFFCRLGYQCLRSRSLLCLRSLPSYYFLFFLYFQGFFRLRHRVQRANYQWIQSLQRQQFPISVFLFFSCRSVPPYFCFLSIPLEVGKLWRTGLWAFSGFPTSVRFPKQFSNSICF